MKKRFIEELEEGDLVQEVFLAKQSLMKTARGGSNYIDMVLTDKTGKINAKLWDATRQVHESFDVDDFVIVRATVESYMGRLQLNVTHIRKIGDQKVDIADFLPVTEKNRDEMLRDFNKLKNSVKDKHLSALLAEFFAGRDSVEKKFIDHPAAVSLHHGCLGGLLAHTLEVASMAAQLADRYSFLDRDLLVTAALLHDIGKIEELECNKSFRYSDSGSLIGHIVMGAGEVQKRAEKVKNFPQES